MIRVLTEADLRSVVTLGSEELAAVEAVYPLISSGAAQMPPIMRIDVPEHRGEIDVKSAYLPGYPGIAVKLSSGFFDNPSRGLPSLGGLMVLLDAQTGVPTAALFDNGFLTDLRTALAGAVAASHLAVSDATRVGIVGAGLQARLQLRALLLVRGVAQVRVWARRPAEAQRFADDMAAELELPVEVAATVAGAAADADILVTTTPSTDPLVHTDALRHGLHVTAVGSDTEHKQELAADVLAAADVLVTDRVAQSRVLGELRAALTAGVDVDHAIELGEVIAGRQPGRTSAEQVSVCDLTGTGAQDTAIASLAVQRCTEAGLGMSVAT